AARRANTLRRLHTPLPSFQEPRHLPASFGLRLIRPARVPEVVARTAVLAPCTATIQTVVRCSYSDLPGHKAAMRGSTARIALLAAARRVGPCTAAPAPPSPAAPRAAAADPPPAAPPREPVRVGYAAIAGSFAAPWMAKEAGLFEKYGLDADLTYIASG